MSSQASRIVATLILLACLVCPVLELFDHWDHTAQTGNDTEYALVVVGVCIGVTYAFARFFLPPVIETTSKVILNFSLVTLARGGRGSFFIVLIQLSPPALALRI